MLDDCEKQTVKDHSNNGLCDQGHTDPDAKGEWPIECFDDMNLKMELLRGIYSYGFEKPSPIQARAIPPCKAGRDTIVQAQSGTGKTGAFGIAVLQMIEPTLRSTQALMLSPSREIALQTKDVLTYLASFMPVNIACFIGGKHLNDDVEKLRNGVHVAVGTVGRIRALIDRGYLRGTQCIKTLVLDEADVLLDLGFRDDICQIFKAMPKDIQVILVSATLPERIIDLSMAFMRDPIKILVKKEQLTLEGIRQFYVDVGGDENKFECIIDLYDSVSLTQSVIFANTRAKVESLSHALEQRHFTVSTLHGQMTQDERDDVMRQFRAGASRVLLASDLVARGIDVQQVSLVLNYELPTSLENYMHRIGRSGRHGKKGVAINLVNRQEMKQLEQIQSYYSTIVEELPTDFGRYL